MHAYNMGALQKAKEPLIEKPSILLACYHNLVPVGSAACVFCTCCAVISCATTFTFENHPSREVPTNPVPAQGRL
jgi:hypothetical protein